jgi:hypothetical protein
VKKKKLSKDNHESIEIQNQGLTNNMA